MLKVFIVDDDSVARTNIKTLIDWCEHGFEICGEAINGRNAIESIRKYAPDIVITDMSMPVMDGVALIEFLEKVYPNIKIIALSGYDDFNYVRQSLKKGAVDYLLKHKLSSDILLNVLQVVKDMIFSEQEKENQKHQLQNQINESRTVLKKAFIKQLMNGEITDEKEIEEKVKVLNLDIDTKNLALVIVEVDDYHFLQKKFDAKEMNKLILSMINISNEILKDIGKAVITHLEAGKFVIIFSFGNMRSDLYTYNIMVTAINRIKVNIKRYLNITASFSLSKIIYNITDIHKAYNEAEITLKEKFFKGKDIIIREISQVNVDIEYSNLDIEEEKQIITALKSMDRQKVKHCIETVFTKMNEAKISYKSIQMICVELINIINRVAREYGFDVKTVYSDEEIPYDEMKKYETITEVRQWVITVYEKLIQLIEAARIDASYTDTTKKAIKYIQKNYSKNISLSEVAAYIGVNSSYLSRIFKEECGKSFVEYLKHLRVEHAKHLIEEGGIKLKDIAKEVGFNNYTYFYKVFKDIIKMTPLEYEEQYHSANYKGI